MSENTGRGHAVAGGVLAGLVAGLALLIGLMIVNATQGGNIWLATKGAAVPLLHERAQQPGWDGPAVVLGLMIHFAISIVWGALFAAIFYGLSRGATVIAGLVWGIVVWLVMYYLVLPIVGLGQVAHTVPIQNAVLTHLGFGLVTSLVFLPFQRTRLHAPPPAQRPALP